MKKTHDIRTPKTCPPGFLGRYTVRPTDTFFTIAQMFRIRLATLAANNPHIPNTNIIYPGDVLCVPGLIPYPCTIILKAVGRVPFGTGGVAFVNFAPRGGQAVSFLATLPQPETFGDFDIYVGEILIPNINGFGNQLFPTPEDPPSWSTRVELPTVVLIEPNSQVVIRPSNSTTGISGEAILEAIIHSGSCHLCGFIQ